MSYILIQGSAKILGKTKFWTEDGPSYDSTAAAYIAAVEAADGQALEASVKTAYNNFIVDCKADGIWNAIKASCILAGARTLNGALIPLVGTAPTNFNFVSADYNRKTGLVGNGSTKYLSSNRNNNVNPQNNSHGSVYVSALGSSGASSATYMGVGIGSSVGTDQIMNSTLNGILTRSRGNTTIFHVSTNLPSGFIAHSRNGSSNYIKRLGKSNSTITASSFAPFNGNILIFSRGTSTTPVQLSNGRISFYSIGESIDLAKLDTRVSALMTAINSAI
jgi:hypothetical protein